MDARTDVREIEFPSSGQAGIMGEWALPLGEVERYVPDGASVETFFFTGRFLGVGSSYRPEHVNHRTGSFAPVRTTCRACRWFETRLFREGEEGDGEFIIYNVGQSIVPGEKLRCRYERVQTAFEVVEILTTRRLTGVPGQPPEWLVSLSKPAARVLAQAAAHDQQMHDAYIDRGVA